MKRNLLRYKVKNSDIAFWATEKTKFQGNNHFKNFKYANFQKQIEGDTLETLKNS